ncbi:hypothetical protein TARUN_9328 [Trichoderma arundinaceum]|uniref:Uncharacterized protein n=1 Tax=Trichoderma arundinaceum TaxID=490622 RepID=A0A395NA84_TRIAR|nr:hypothetical protein TARUN_9328 [Trichoderma arundinaceum]
MPPRPPGQDITQLVAFRQQPLPVNPYTPPPATSLVHNSSTGNARLFDFNVAQQQLRPYIKNALQDAVLRLPGRIVTFVRGRVRPEQIMGMRDSYVNAFLIQSRGSAVQSPCEACRRQMTLDPDSYAKPFPTCVRLPGHFGGSCGNCKWRDHASRCSERDALGAPVRQGRSASNSPPHGGHALSTLGPAPAPAPAPAPTALPRPPLMALTGAGSVNNPINLDDSPDDSVDNNQPGGSSTQPIQLDDDDDDGDDNNNQAALVVHNGVGDTGTTDQHGFPFTLG